MNLPSEMAFFDALDEALDDLDLTLARSVNDVDATDTDTLTEVANRMLRAFEQWLAKHDRQVMYKAWDEGCEYGKNTVLTALTLMKFIDLPDKNPYREEES